MNKDINKLIITAIVLVLIFGFISLYFIFESYETNKTLDIVRSNFNTTANELDITKNKLTVTQEKLSEEVYKSTNLKKSLDDANTELKNIKSELDVANTTINNLKDEEYKFVYLGDYSITHYCTEKYKHICGTGSGITATGTTVTAGRTVAVDPSVIPYGTTIYIEGYGFRVAEDCGGAVNGNHIDVAVETHADAYIMGSGYKGVWILVKNS